MIKCFSIHEKINQFWRNQICKDCTLMFMMVFEIHCTFFIVLLILLTTFVSVFFFFTMQHVHTRKIGCVLEVLRASAGIGCATCPGLYCYITPFNQISPAILWDQELKYSLIALKLLETISRGFLVLRF